jgi:monolysocardiolipin acyltransferase
MRYFKWGVARLILESEPCPDIVPVFVEGVMEIMPEDRAPPRYIPELGKRVGVTFGEKVEEEVFSGFRERWKRLREKAGVHGEELNEELMTGNEAVALRIEVTSRVRKEIESLRRQRGYSDEDPKQGAAETWRLEGPKKTGRMDDGSLVGET